MDKEKTRQRVLLFAQGETNRANAPLYVRLALAIADDDRLLELVGHMPPGQPVPLLLFAAVQYLLLRDDYPHPLRSFYLGLTPNPDSGDPLPTFRAFCEEHRDAIIHLLNTRLVQTNEVRRSATLLPAFGAIYQETGNETPLALIEIGPSAGLNLLWDRYRYVYGEPGKCRFPTLTWGNEDAAVTLNCELRGPTRPTLPPPSPPIASRVGLDLNPIDPADADQTLWLRALVWPEQEGRVALLESALEEARQHPPTLLRGDALELLPPALAEIPVGATPCVFHSFALNQFSREMREQFDVQLCEAAAALGRPVYRVFLEGISGDSAPLQDRMRYDAAIRPDPLLALTRYNADATRTERWLGFADPHGAWLEWQG